MLSLLASFKNFLSNLLVSLFGALIPLFFQLSINQSITQSSLRILQPDYGPTPTPTPTPLDFHSVQSQPDTLSVLASTSAKYQLELTTQIHGFLEESETTTNCFVQELFCVSPSSGNQTLEDLWEFSSETEESEQKDVKLEQISAEEEGLEKEDEHEDFGVIFEEVENFGLENEILNRFEPSGEDFSFSLSESDLESLNFDEEYIEIELEPQLHVSNVKVLPVNDWSEEENEDDFREPKKTEWDFEEEEEEFLQEHQDLINQLKIEIRNSRTGGLPTVHEEEEEEEEEEEAESISPTSVKPLKPLKYGGNFEHKEQFREIQKVYKTYAEKMRKLDISNTQINCAIDLVKLKDPINPIDGRKFGIKSLVSHKLRSRKAEKGCPRLMRDLKRELEMVYVGHLCLSWEVLHWQHRKAIELQLNHSPRTSHYTRVVNEFQLFSILIQRFIEDERFSGPRIENYCKNRLLIRSLLQVPPIREESVNDKKLRGKEDETVISTATLVSIIEDSMRVFREFVKTDKHIGNPTIKSAKVQVHHTDLPNPFDAQLLMMEIRTNLQKKERRLKDIVRSGNCIVKKLQSISEEEGRLKNELLIAEIELKLVSRVVSMSRLTESQLIWCHKKLHQLNFVNRKVIIEPSFLLFPC